MDQILLLTSPTGRVETVITSAPPSSNDCKGIPPFTVGDCNDHCLQGKLAGTVMTLRASALPPAEATYFYLDLIPWYSAGKGDPITMEFEEQFSVTPGTHQVSVSFDTATYAPGCIILDSAFYLTDKKGKTAYKFLTAYVRVH